MQIHDPLQSMQTLFPNWNQSTNHRHSIVTLKVMVEHPDPSFPFPHIRTA
jgi:hypothetical protein